MRTLLLDNLAFFASNQHHKDLLVSYLKADSSETEGLKFGLTKSQRYAIIRIIFRNTEKFSEDERNAFLDAEIKKDYSDFDERMKLSCIASLPHPETKEKLWEFYVTVGAFSKQELIYSSSHFYNSELEIMQEIYSK